jgi:exosortase
MMGEGRRTRDEARGMMQEGRFDHHPSSIVHHPSSVIPRADLWRQLSPHVYIKILIIAGLLWFLFYREINYIIYQWIHDSNWSHGFLIPLFSLYFINQHKSELLRFKARPSYIGLILLVCSILLYLFNVVSPSGWAYLRSLSIIAALGSIILFLGGWGMLKYTALPTAFLIFAIPLPERFYKAATIPMRQWAATAAAAVLNLVGSIEASSRGVMIDIIYKGQQLEPSLDVAEACSGMRFLMAFLALGVAMAYLHYRPAWQRIVLLISTVPIAIFCNIVRVTVTGFIYVLANPKYTQGIYHDAIGFAMLPLAFGLYGFFAWFMSNLFAENNKVCQRDIVTRREGTK